MSRRRDAATATMGAGLTATGGYLRHAGVQELIRHQGGDEPKVHGLAIALRGNALSRKLYGAGAVTGLIGAPALGIGATKLVRRKPKEVIKRDKPSFLQEGIKGTGEALAERKDTLAQRDVPAKARAAGMATTLAAGAGGAYGARGLLRHHSPGRKALLTPIAGVLAGAAATPLSSRVVSHVSPGYEVTPSGVRRKKRALKRASSASFQHRDTPRSFQADIAKDASTRRYRAKVTAVGSVPIPGVNWAAQARTAGALAPKGQKRRAEATQFSGSATGDVAGFLGGAHGAAYLAQHNDGFKRGAEAANAKIESVKARLPKIPHPKINMPAGASSGRAGRVVRAAVRPLKNPKTAAAAAVGGFGGQMLVGNAMQQAAMTRNIHQGRVKKSITAPGMTRKEQEKQLKRKSRLIAINTLGATTGAAGLATYGASKHPGLHAHKPQLEGLTLGLGALGGGIGSYGGFKRARVERKDVRAQRKALGVSKIAPRVVYHGTDYSTGNKIRRGGVKALKEGPGRIDAVGSGQKTGALDERGHGVYVSTNPDSAAGYSRRQWHGKRGNAVVRLMTTGPRGEGPSGGGFLYNHLGERIRHDQILDAKVVRLSVRDSEDASYMRHGNADGGRNRLFRKSMPDPSALHVPTGLLKVKTYAASSVRATPTGKLVRTKAGVR